MRALFMVPRYHPHIGGVEYVVKSVAERLAGRGHEVVVLCGELGVEKPEEELINGVHVVRWLVHAPEDAWRLDTFARNEGLELTENSLVKIDAEGMALRVLMGGVETLSSSKPKDGN